MVLMASHLFLSIRLPWAALPDYVNHATYESFLLWGAGIYKSCIYATVTFMTAYSVETTNNEVDGFFFSFKKN